MIESLREFLRELISSELIQRVIEFLKGVQEWIPKAIEWVQKFWDWLYGAVQGFWGKFF